MTESMAEEIAVEGVATEPAVAMVVDGETTEPAVAMVVDGETTEANGVQSGEKRPQIGGGNELVEPQVSKKARNDPELGRDLRRVAEIVLVMSTMAAVRGGKKPSDAEVGLMAEARAKLVEICEGLAPKEIVGRAGIASVIEDLGLNGKSKDQKLGFRGPRLTIAEKVVQAKRKMEESKKYITTSVYGSHPAQANLPPSVESRGSLPSVRMFPADKSSNLPTSVASSLPPSHVSASGSASIPVQLPSNEVRAHVISSGLPINHQGRDSSTMLHRTERQLNGTYGSQMQVNNPLASASTWTVQTQSASSAKSGTELKMPNSSAASGQGTMDSSTLRSTSQAARDQSGRPSISQTVAGNVIGLQPPLQGVNFMPAPSHSNNHNEIVKIIQKLLQPQLSDHPTWNPPSRDYMNKAVTCQTCQITINEVDTVLICDACEKGYHLKCASSNLRTIPRGEWHCSRCLIISGGKPLPPKYGRVMRSNPPLKVPVNTSGVQQPEKRSGSMDQKASASQLKLVSDGGSDSQNLQPGDHSSNANELSATKIPGAGEVPGDLVQNSKDINEIPTSSLNTPAKSLEPVHDASSVELSSEKAAQLINSSEPSKGEEAISESPAKPPNVSLTVPDNFNCPEPPDNSQVVDKETVSELGSAHSTVKKEDNEIVQENNIKEFEAGMIDKEQPVTSTDDLRVVEWVGEVEQLADGKANYKSCSVDGVTYNVQEYVLFHSSQGKLMPFKLMSLCHDFKNGSKWAVLKRCYFPDDLPENVIRPSSPELNEVYVSEHYCCLMAGLIRGSCEILPLAKFKEEIERRSQLNPEADNGTKPVFLCKWSYDESKMEFEPHPS